MLRGAMLSLASVLDGRPAAGQDPAALLPPAEVADLLLGLDPASASSLLPPPAVPFMAADADGGRTTGAVWLMGATAASRSLHPADQDLPPAPPLPRPNGVPALAASAPVLGDALRGLVGPVAARHALPGPASAAPDAALGALAGRLTSLAHPPSTAPAVPTLTQVVRARVAVAAPDALRVARRALAARGSALALTGARGRGSPRARAAGLLAREVDPFPPALAPSITRPSANLPPAVVVDAHGALEAAARAARTRVARARMAILRASDMKAYLRLAREAASDRLAGLLAETDGVLRSLVDRLGVELVDPGPAPGAAAAGPPPLPGAPPPTTDALASSTAAWAGLAAQLAADGLDAQPTALVGTLRPYQLEGVRWMVGLAEAGVNGVLADEMGLGKTAQSIATFVALKERAEAAGGGGVPACGPFLVVAPSTLVSNWAAELAAWAPRLRVACYRGPPADRAALWTGYIKPRTRGGPCRGGLDVVVTTYEFAMAPDDARRLGAVPWRLMVVDEGHRLKNAASKLTAALAGYRSGGRFLLTGTPLQNRLAELWALLNFLVPAAFPSASEFEAWFGGSLGGDGGGGAGGRRDGDSEEDASLLDEESRLLVTNRLHQVLRPFFLRRLKADVAGELPAKVEHVLTVPPSAYQAALVGLIRAGLEGRGAPGAPRGVANAVMELRTIANHPFLSRLHPGRGEALLGGGGDVSAGEDGASPSPSSSPSLPPPPCPSLPSRPALPRPSHPLHPTLRACGKLEILDRLALLLHASGRRVLIFATMTRALDVIQAALGRRGLPCERLDGGTPGPERDAAVARFNDPTPGPFAFLLSVRAGGVGLNLQAADAVVMYDTDWNPAVDAQAQGRAHRLGQARAVQVFRLRTAGSIEERIQAAAAGKQAAADASITGGFFDGRTSEAARRDYLVGVLRGNGGGGTGGGGGGGGGARRRAAASSAPLAPPTDADLVSLLASRPGAPQGEAATLAGAAARRAAAEAARVGGAPFSRLLADSEPDAAALAAAAVAAAAPRAPTPLDQLGRGKRVRVPVLAPPPPPESATMPKSPPRPPWPAGGGRKKGEQAAAAVLSPPPPPPLVAASPPAAGPSPLPSPPALPAAAPPLPPFPPQAALEVAHSPTPAADPSPSCPARRPVRLRLPPGLDRRRRTRRGHLQGGHGRGLDGRRAYG